jgi:hypothetical protein
MTPTTVERNTLAAPPRMLLWLSLMFLIALLLAALGVVQFIAGGRRVSSLVPFLALAAVALPAASVISALIMRRGLPRRFWLILLILWLILFAVGAAGSVFAYRGLEPRYQAEMLTYAPFMQQFMRPTPQGGTIPTAAVTSAISPQDLLQMPVGAVAESTETSTPAATATSAPTSTVFATDPATPTEVAVVPSLTAAPTEAAVSVAAGQPLPSSAFMYGFRWERQDWNNCGPTNITMALSHFGWQEDADYAASFIRPQAEDKNVSPGELVNFVNTQTGVRAITRIGGDMQLLKTLIANNFPIVIETTFTPEGYDWIGHYQTVVGYDDATRNFYVYDSYLGAGTGSGIPEPYDQFDADWQAFNRVFIVLYEIGREQELITLLGERADLTRAAELALEVARQEAQADPTNAFAWFNIGTAYTKLGEYEQAAAAFDEAARRQLPFRMLWYQFGPFEAYLNVGRYDDVMALVQNNLTNAGGYVEETYYWQGRVYEAQNQLTQAAASYQRALAQNPQYTAAAEAYDRVT